MKITLRLFGVLVVAGATMAPAQDAPGAVSTASPAACAALASGAWNAALAECSQSLPLPAVIREVEGRCFLALNRNNDSLAMFLSLCSGRTISVIPHLTLGPQVGLSTFLVDSLLSICDVSGCTLPFGKWNLLVVLYERLKST